MSRDELKSKADPGGFIEYGKEQLPKIDSMRRDKSQPDFFGIPILRDDQVGFTTADELDNKPASCYTCKEHNPDGTCEYLGPTIKVIKVTGHKDSGDPIEYWPCCSEQVVGDHGDKTTFHDDLCTPDGIGLIWINASKPGQKFGGANCGGVNGGDDCDHYIVQGKQDKWDTEQGACRILQRVVNAGDVCRAWWDDDILEWQEAQQLIKGDKISVEQFAKRRLARDIIKKDY